MQERIKSSDPSTPDVIVQHNSQQESVGVGLETTRDGMSDLHFLDAIYGDSFTQREIGRIFASRASELDITIPVFHDSDSESDWHYNLGRIILDSVTGSSKVDGSWTWLERASVNRLIRLLRKARDNAFGRDE